MPADRPLLSIRDAADLLGMSEATARRLARTGNLPGLVAIPGHRLLVRRRILEQWLAGERDDSADAGEALRVVR